MNVHVNNQSIDLNTTQFVHYMDGVSLFVGLTDVNKEVFVPFYWDGGHYNSGYLFDNEESMKIYDKDEELNDLNRTSQRLVDDYECRLAEFPQSVTNVDLFKKIITNRGGVFA